MRAMLLKCAIYRPAGQRNGHPPEMHFDIEGRLMSTFHTIPGISRAHVVRWAILRDFWVI